MDKKWRVFFFFYFFLLLNGCGGKVPAAVEPIEEVVVEQVEELAYDFIVR